ncbi:MAG: hypothetical protein ACRCXL_10560 [Dermatophilaceae bacterium]
MPGDRYTMEATALSRHADSIEAAHTELISLLRTFEASAEPLAGTFSGQGKAAFDLFKADTDQIAADLGISLTSVQEGTRAQDLAFTTGDEEMHTTFTSRRSVVDAGPTGTTV